MISKLRIDLVVFFSSERINSKHIHELIPPHIMRKEITKDIAENQLRLNCIPELNLKTFPISIKEGPQDRLLPYLVSIFEKM